MALRYFEDFNVGDTFPLPEVTVTREGIIHFAKQFDPQVFHLQDETPITEFGGGLIASGWHVCAMFMRLLDDGFLLDAACVGSPGVTDLKWRHAVRPGDKLHGRATVTDVEPWPKDGALGLVRFHHEVFNQNAERAMSMNNPLLFRRRGPSAPPRNAYEQIAIGDVHPFGSVTFTPEAIKTFAADYDPRPMHRDGTPERPLTASPWHVASAMMRMLVTYFDAVDVKSRAAGEPVLVSGPSPGFDDLTWPNPVHAGDTVMYTARIVAKRTSNSRPGWGLLSMTTTGVNQHGLTVFTVTTHVFVETGS